MKYVIVQQEMTGYILPVVFPDEIVHKTVAQAVVKANRPCKVISAGFLVKQDGNWVPTKEGSDSLKIGPGLLDGLILRMFLEEGVTSLQLSNLLTYVQLQGRKNA